MTVADAQRRAQELLAEATASPFGDLATPPVDVETIAEELAGLLVLPADLQQQGGEAISGLLVPVEKRLLYDRAEAERWPNRRRFTIAHELGHWYVHHAHGAGEERYCRSTDVTVSLESGYGLEREANAFGAALLMPAELVVDEARRTRCNIGLLAQTFGASRAAMKLRLEHLDLLPEYMR